MTGTVDRYTADITVPACGQVSIRHGLNTPDTVVNVFNQYAEYVPFKMRNVDPNTVELMLGVYALGPVSGGTEAGNWELSWHGNEYAQDVRVVVVG